MGLSQDIDPAAALKAVREDAIEMFGILECAAIWSPSLNRFVYYTEVSHYDATALYLVREVLRNALYLRPSPLILAADETIDNVQSIRQSVTRMTSVNSTILVRAVQLGGEGNWALQYKNDGTKIVGGTSDSVSYDRGSEPIRFTCKEEAVNWATGMGFVLG